MSGFWRNWRITFLLLLIVLIPIALTISRLIWLAGGEESVREYPDYAHMMRIPLPIVLHIVFGSIFCLIACFQFNLHLRKRAPRLHRIAGRIAVASGLISAITGSVMTIIYPLGELSTVTMAAVRFAFGCFMTIALTLAVINAMQRNLAAHRAWMIRSFAIGVAGATQALLLIICFALLGQLDKYVVTYMVILGFVINWAIAEFRIRTTSKPISPLKRNIA